MGAKKLFDAGDFLGVQTEGSGGENSVNLVGSSCADNCSGNDRIMQRPGNGYHARLDRVSLSDLTQEFHELKVAREFGFAEVGTAASPVVLGHVLDTLGGHLAGQQSRRHGRVVDHADVVFT